MANDNKYNHDHSEEFLKGYKERGHKVRQLSNEDADKFGMSIKSVPGSALGRLEFKSPEHRKAFDDHMRGTYKREREATERREKIHSVQYGTGHNMKAHGEGKPHGHKEG